MISLTTMGKETRSLVPPRHVLLATLAMLFLANGCNGGETPASGDGGPPVVTPSPRVDPALCELLERTVVAGVDGLEVLWDDGCGDTTAVGVPDAAAEVQAAVREGFVLGLSRAFIHPKLDPEKGNWDRPATS